MARWATLLLVLSCSLSAGCLGAPRLEFQDAFGQSDATHDGTVWQVSLRGRVVNLVPEEIRRVVLRAGVGPDCLNEPALPGYLDVGNLAGGASVNVRDAFEQEGPPLDAPHLWWRLRSGEGGAEEGKGCGRLASG